MSAIFGSFNLDGRPAGSEELGRMGDALTADGPNGGDVWIDGAVGLGQRLMRFTPEDSFERQPLCGCGGKAVLVADARIDNRPELTASFGLDAADAAVLPDSAFMMKAYEKWGQECVHHLIGEFAFAVWDARTKSLFAACSPVGERPLHYHCTPRGFAFASMPRGLLALPWVPRVLNEAKVADYLVRIQREPDSTFYKGISRLPGGYCLTVEVHGVKVSRFWNPDLTRRLRFKNDDDYVDAFLELFDRVVNDHLRSATPTGVSMSGGLDSSAVGVTAAGLLQPRGGRLAAYTEVPRAGFTTAARNFYPDETPLVQAIARRHPNIDLNLVRTDGHFFMEDLPAYFKYAEVPFRNTSNRVWLEAIRSLAKQHGTRVLLNGSLGNLTVSWDGLCLIPELVREGRWQRALQEARAANRGRNGPALRLLAARGLLSLLPRSIQVPLARRRRDPGAISYFGLGLAPIHPAFAAEQGLPGHLRKEDDRYLHEQRTGMRDLRRRLATQSDLIGPMASGYRARFGVEARDPTGDTRTIEFCLALPEEQCRRGGQSRLLIRRAMKDRWPAEVVNNRGKGLQAADWLERQEAALPQMMRELDLIERSESARSMLDTARLRRLLEERPTNGGDENHDEGRMQLDYQTILETGLMVGRYIRWFEEGE